MVSIIYNSEINQYTLLDQSHYIGHLQMQVYRSCSPHGSSTASISRISYILVSTFTLQNLKYLNQRLSLARTHPHLPTYIVWIRICFCNLWSEDKHVSSEIAVVTDAIRQCIHYTPGVHSGGDTIIQFMLITKKCL
jgi:hypothetical protein